MAGQSPRAARSRDSTSGGRRRGSRRTSSGATGPFEFDLIAGGHSNLTFAVTASDGSRFVLRRPPLGHVLASAHDMGREHRDPGGVAGHRRAGATGRGLLLRPGRHRRAVLRDGLRGRSRHSRRRHGEGGTRHPRPARMRADRSSTRWRRSMPSTSSPRDSTTSAATRATSPASCDAGTARSASSARATCRRSTASTMPSRHASPIRSAPRWCTATTGSTTAWSTTTVSWSPCSTGRSARSAIRSPTSGC